MEPTADRHPVKGSTESARRGSSGAFGFASRLAAVDREDRSAWSFLGADHALQERMGAPVQISFRCANRTPSACGDSPRLLSHHPEARSQRHHRPPDRCTQECCRPSTQTSRIRRRRDRSGTSGRPSRRGSAHAWRRCGLDADDRVQTRRSRNADRRPPPSTVEFFRMRNRCRASMRSLSWEPACTRRESASYDARPTFLERRSDDDRLRSPPRSRLQHLETRI